MMTNRSKKHLYEHIPDIETGPLIWANTPMMVDAAIATEKAKKKYAYLKLSDDQVRLLGSVDEAMKFENLGMTLNLLGGMSCLNDLEHEDWSTKAISFAKTSIQPTMISTINMGVAIYLQDQYRLQRLAVGTGTNNIEEQAAPFVSFLVAVFPYFNASVIFLATALPMQRRLMEGLVEPVFKAMNQAEEFFKGTIHQLGLFVDAMIDSIQQDFHTVLKPIQPTLDKIQRKVHLLENVIDGNNTKFDNLQKKKKMNIPDPSDIDRELDEAQGIVSDRMKEAEKHLEYEDYVPNYLSSPHQFYWRIVVPLLLLAWVLQLLVAFGNEHLRGLHMQKSCCSIRTLSEISTYRNDLMDETMDAKDHPQEALHKTMLNLHKNVLDELQPCQNRRDLMADNTTEQLQNVLQEKVDTYEENMTDQLYQSQHQANETWQNLVDQIHQEFQYQVEEIQSRLVEDVLWSYIMAVMQMLLIHLMTSKACQEWVVKQGMKQIQKGAEKTLQDYGVLHSLWHLSGLFRSLGLANIFRVCT